MEAISGTNDPLLSVYFINENVGFIAGYYGTLLKTVDGGQLWSSYPTTYSFDEVRFVNDSTGWAVGPGRNIIKTTDCGETWITQSIGGGPEFLYSCHFTDENNGWAVGEDGLILKTSDGGTSWGVQNSGTIEDLTSVFFTNNKQGWIAGLYGTILNTTNGGGITGNKNDDFSSSHSFALLQNYPNPFNPSTTIRYEIPEKRFVSLKIFDILGREVSSLVDQEKPAGIYEITFNGSTLPSGVYIYRLTAGKYSAVRKLLLLK